MIEALTRPAALLHQSARATLRPRAAGYRRGVARRWLGSYQRLLPGTDGAGRDASLSGGPQPEPWQHASYCRNWSTELGDAVEIDEYGTTHVDLKKIRFKDDSFVFLKDVIQIFHERTWNKGKSKKMMRKKKKKDNTLAINRRSRSESSRGRQSSTSCLILHLMLA
jgi:hypothetical protein